MTYYAYVLLPGIKSQSVFDRFRMCRNPPPRRGISVLFSLIVLPDNGSAQVLHNVLTGDYPDEQVAVVDDGDEILIENAHK